VITSKTQEEIYQDAVALFDDSRFAEARESFKSIRGYKDSQAYIQKCSTEMLANSRSVGRKHSLSSGSQNVITSDLKLKQFIDEETADKKEDKQKKKKGFLSFFGKKDDESKKEKSEKPKIEPKADKRSEKELGITKGPKRPYVFPSISYTPDPRIEELLDQCREECRSMVDTLCSFFDKNKLDVSYLSASVGPSVSMLEFALGESETMDRIKKKEKELSYVLGGKKIRLLLPIPNKTAIGIEVPNSKRVPLSFFEVFSKGFDDGIFSDLNIPMVVGRNYLGNDVIVDVSEMPHAIIAGTTGSGKSMCVNSMICSVILSKTPDEVKMILVDPKVVELSAYNGIPHLLLPVVTDYEKTVQVFDWLVEEMEHRYQSLAESKVRNIKEYNKVARQRLPYILLVVDEFADLMAVGRKQIEGAISRLAAKARAVGIHIVLSTQRPSADVITGVLKSNLPGRIALSVSSAVNSRIIMDEPGAEYLTGKGDMIMKLPSSDFPERIQGTFISTEEINSLIKDITVHNR